MNIPETEISRRRFLTTASGLMAAGLTALPGADILAQVTPEKTEVTPEKKEDLPKPIIYRTLGRTGIKIPIVSMGVMNANVPEVLAASYEEGVRHFDTAAAYQYGKNEEMVGNVIKKLGVRDKVTIATKIGLPQGWQDMATPATKNALVNKTEECLRRMKMDYVDIMYLHGLSDPKEVSHPAFIEALAALKEQKKILFAGVTTHSKMTAVINEAAKVGSYDVVLTVVNFALSSYTELFDAIKNAAAKGIGIIGMKTFYGSPDTLSMENAEWLKNHSSATIVSACMKWVLRNENITTIIPGYTNFDHMKQNFAVARDLEYTPDEEIFLSEQGLKLGFDFCRQCRTCLAACPNDVEIPDLMRTYMYAAQYGNLCQARITLEAIPSGKSLQNCRACTTCSVQCVNAVDIARRIDTLKLIYG
jgi:predicted aldo/keto reductase-like oxidoreductase